MEGSNVANLDAILSMPVDGLEELWEWTHGDPRVIVAVLDGPVDRSHPVFDGAELIEVDVPRDLAEGVRSQKAVTLESSAG
jgi:hypothetical protein